MKSFIVSFEVVSPMVHPEHYCTGHGAEHPVVEARDVPEEHWTPVLATYTNHSDAVAHLRGLHQLALNGELVRNTAKRTVEHPGAHS